MQNLPTIARDICMASRVKDIDTLGGRIRDVEKESLAIVRALEGIVRTSVTMRNINEIEQRAFMSRGCSPKRATMPPCPIVPPT